MTTAALDAAGVIRCDDLDELLEAAELVAGVGRLGRRLRGGRTGVVTVSTGEASLVADLAERTGIDLPPVTDGAREAILRDLPTMGYIGNPLDPWGAAEEGIAYRASFEALAASGAYDVLADRARQPVPRAAQRGGRGHDREPRARRGDGRPAGDPAGLRVADVQRRERRGQGVPRRARRHADAQGRGRGVRGDRPAGRLGAAARGPASRPGRGGRPGRRWPRTACRGAATRSLDPLARSAAAPVTVSRCPSARASSGSPRPGCR